MSSHDTSIAPASPALELSIVIVSFNACRDLDRCLSSLAASPPAATHEIIVVDNGSSDGSADAARRHGVRVIETGANLGFGRANNIGIRAGRGGSVLLLNSDTVVARTRSINCCGCSRSTRVWPSSALDWWMPTGERSFPSAG